MSAPLDLRFSRHGGHGSIEDDEAKISRGERTRETDFCDRVCQRGVKCALADYCITGLIFCLRVVEWGSRSGEEVQGEEEEAGKEDARRASRKATGEHGKPIHYTPWENATWR